MLSTTTNDNLNLRLGKVDRALDCLEQYCRRNCKLIHGINEENQEKTDAVVITILKKAMFKKTTGQDKMSEQQFLKAKEN